MLAMQYSFTLPRDYDMGIIRKRVAERGPLLDGFANLDFKAFLISEAGVDGQLENRYAPFYLWRSEAGTNEFLLGAPFAGLVHDFGRPSVQHWIPLVAGRSVAGAPPRFATRQIIPILPGADLSALRQSETEAQNKALSEDGVFARVVAFDPKAWELVRFTLWTTPPSGDNDPADTLRYEVLHLSEGD